MPRLTHGTIERALGQDAQSRKRKTLADGEGRTGLRISAIGLSFLLLCAPAHGQSGANVEEFYKGKTIAVVCPFDAEGGYGFVTRAIAQYLPRYLPGRPKGVPQFRPGANGVVAAGYMYNVAERDGSVIGLMYDGVPTYQVTQPRNAHFDVRNFVVLGSIDRGQTAALAVWKKSGVTTIQQAQERELILGADSTASVQYLIPQALNRAAGTKFKIVSGYKGATAVFLAMERNEIDGLFTNYATIARHRPQWIRDLNFLGQLGEGSDPALANVPQVYELAKTEVDKEAIKFLIYTRITGDAVIAPPGIPADRAAALRRAFEAMVLDPEFIKLMTEAGRDVAPRSWQEESQLLLETVGIKPSVLSRMQELTAP